MRPRARHGGPRGTKQKRNQERTQSVGAEPCQSGEPQDDSDQTQINRPARLYRQGKIAPDTEGQRHRRPGEKMSPLRLDGLNETR